MMRVLPPRVYGTGSALRKRYLPAGMAHPAKLVVELQLDLIRRYTQPGQWIVDPFGGIGSALLAAALPLLDPWEAPRHVLVHELEANFAADARQNWAHLHRLAGQQAGRTYVDPLTGERRVGVALGEVRILQGDSRHLPLPSAAAADGTPAPFDPLVALRLTGASDEELRRSEAEPAILLHHLRALAAQGHRPAVAWVAREKRRGQWARTGHHPIGTPQAAIGSPPYRDARQSWPTPEGAENVRYGSSAGQIGGLAHGDVAAAVGSPPYVDSVQARDRLAALQRAIAEGRASPAVVARFARLRAGDADEAALLAADGYGAAAGQIGLLPAGDVDAICSSPPFGEANAAHAGGNVTQRPNKDGVGFEGGREAFVYSEDTPGQVGNMPYGDVAAVVSSPPYAEALTYQQAGAGGEHWELLRAGYTPQQIAQMRRDGDPRVTQTRREAGYSRSSANIGNLAHTDAVQLTKFTTDAGSPRDELGRVVVLASVAGEERSQTLGEQSRNTPGLWVVVVERKPEPVTLADMPKDAASGSRGVASEEDACLSDCDHGQRAPVWKLAFKPVGKASIATGLRLTQLNQLLRLLALDAQVRQQGVAARQSNGVAAVPDVERAASLGRGLLQVERAAEGAVEQLGHLWRDLFQANNLGEHLRPAASAKSGRPRPLDREVSIGIHGASQISEGEQIGRHGLDCAISSPPYATVASRDRSQEPYCQAQDPVLRAKYGTVDVNRHIDGYGEHTPGQIGDLAHEGLEGWLEQPRHQRPSGNDGARSPTPSEVCPGRTCRGTDTPTGPAAPASIGGRDRQPFTPPHGSETTTVASGADEAATWLPTTSSPGSKVGPPPATTCSPSASPATRRRTPPSFSADASSASGLSRQASQGHSTAPPTARTCSDGRDTKPLEQETYASAMLSVLAECYRVVRPGGILVLVTGNYVRNGAVIDLAADTIKLAVAAGWTPVERWLHQKATISFWRRLHHQQAIQQGRAPAVVTTEDVLVFCKGDQPGWDFAPLPPTTRAPVKLSDRPAAPRPTQGRLLDVLALADQEAQEADGDGDGG